MEAFETSFYEINTKLVNVIDEYKREFNPGQLASILILMGADIAYYCSPDMEEARELIQESVRIVHNKFNKRGERE